MTYQLPKVKALGQDRSHQALSMAGSYRIDEKIDGSQFTFGKNTDGQVWARSKTRYLDLVNPDKMFAQGVAEVLKAEARLVPGWTYVGEYLQKAKHNVLCYSRVPLNHVVVFDVVDNDGLFLPYHQLVEHVAFLKAFEPVACQADVNWATVVGFIASVNEPIDRSQLGGVSEGIVIKAGDHVSTRIIAKIVADRFHEVKTDRTERSQKNPDNDLGIALANKYCPAARFQKAVQRLRENGQASGDMTDIPKLRAELVSDLEGECMELIKDELYKKFRKGILQNSLKPLADWYTQLLQNDNAYWSAQRDALGQD